MVLFEIVYWEPLVLVVRHKFIRMVLHRAKKIWRIVFLVVKVGKWNDPELLYRKNDCESAQMSAWYVSNEIPLCQIRWIPATNCFHLFWRQSFNLLIIFDCLGRQCLTLSFAKRWCVSHPAKWAFLICWSPHFSSKADLAKQLISLLWTTIPREASLMKPVPKEARSRWVTKCIPVQIRSICRSTLPTFRVYKVRRTLRRACFCPYVDG